MPDDIITTDDETTDAPAAHDDIMKRLLDYQRSLRESSPAEGSAEATRPLVDYSAIEAQAAAPTDTEEIVDLTQIEDAEAEEAEEAIEVVETQKVVAPEDAKVAEAEAMRQRVAEEAAVKTTEAPAPEEDTGAVVAVASVPAPAEPEAIAAPDAKLAERVAELEASLDQIAAKLAAVRTEFQDLAIRADERIAEIEESLAAARGSGS